eukprot:g4129.t1
MAAAPASGEPPLEPTVEPEDPPALAEDPSDAPEERPPAEGGAAVAPEAAPAEGPAVPEVSQPSEAPEGKEETKIPGKKGDDEAAGNGDKGEEQEEEQEEEQGEEEEEQNETSPKGRYIKFKELLGRGAFKNVYKAFDSDTGSTVAWNEVNITPLPPSEKRRVISEVKILEKVEHKRIIGFYGSWYNKAEHKVVFITEIVTEGTLRGFCERVNGLKISVVRKWADQILEGLIYLHSQTPPIIHRDLKCENVFVKGEDGSIKIGDLGLSTQAMRDKASPGTVLGTPEFMAPELYTEHYDQTVDVYAFGLVILEMVSMETPYSECTNVGQIITKVTQGLPPQVLERVKVKSLRDFISFCLTKQKLPAHSDEENEVSVEGTSKSNDSATEEGSNEAEKGSEGGHGGAGGKETLRCLCPLCQPTEDNDVTYVIRRPTASEVLAHHFMQSQEGNDNKDLVRKRGEAIEEETEDTPVAACATAKKAAEEHGVSDNKSERPASTVANNASFGTERPVDEHTMKSSNVNGGCQAGTADSSEANLGRSKAAARDTDAQSSQASGMVTAKGVEDSIPKAVDNAGKLSTTEAEVKARAQANAQQELASAAQRKAEAALAKAQNLKDAAEAATANAAKAQAHAAMKSATAALVADPANTSQNNTGAASGTSLRTESVLNPEENEIPAVNSSSSTEVDPDMAALLAQSRAAKAKQQEEHARASSPTKVAENDAKEAEVFYRLKAEVDAEFEEISRQQHQHAQPSNPQMANDHSKPSAEQGSGGAGGLNKLSGAGGSNTSRSSTPRFTGAHPVVSSKNSMEEVSVNDPRSRSSTSTNKSSMDYDGRTRLATHSFGGDDDEENGGDKLGDLIAIAARASSGNSRSMKRRKRPSYRLEVVLASKARQDSHNGGYCFPMLTLRKVEKKFVQVKNEHGEKVVDSSGKAVTEKKVVRYSLSHFGFNLLTDSPQGVAVEMAKELSESGVNEYWIPIITDELIKIKNELSPKAAQCFQHH